MAVSSKYTQDLSVQIVFFTYSCKWFLCFYFWAVIWSYIVDLFAALHELASASARTLLKLASSVRTLLKPYGDTLRCVKQCSASIFPEMCFLFEILRMQKKNIFSMASSEDLSLNEKQKKSFVSLKDEVTIIRTLISYHCFVSSGG